MKPVDKNDFITITNDVIHSAVKNTSCSRGWLRLAVQCVFCSFTVASFCIIVYLSYRRSPTFHDSHGEPFRCSVSNCRVVCVQAPCSGQCEDHIVQALTLSSRDCNNVSLTLNRPEFPNSTVPFHWLTNCHWRARLVELKINGGNLRHISAEAFSSASFHDVQKLLLEELTITNWKSNMLAGLCNLKELGIRKCRLDDIHEYALKEVDNTLERLVIRSSGNFNPENITGSSHVVKLKEVTFSKNYFDGILNRNSFREMVSCEVLSLTSSRITAIQEGTFDALKKIRIIDLSKNRLTTLPNAIFDRIVALGNLGMNIDLQYNMWNCDCQLERLKELHNDGIVITDPVCLSPEGLNGIQFSKIETFCNESTEPVAKAYYHKYRYKLRRSVSIYLSKDCVADIKKVNDTLTHTSTIPIYYNCINGRIKYNEWHSLNFFTQTANRFSTELQPLYYAEDSNFSFVEISLQSSIEYGLLWYKSSCPNEIYCIERLPTNIRLYNIEKYDWYTMCPIHHSGSVDQAKCITFNPSAEPTLESIMLSRNSIFSYVLAILVAGLMGGLAIYGLIRRNPVLLKGSERILFVKHKVTNALVLPPKMPPKIPPRFDTVKKQPVVMSNCLALPGTLNDFTTPMYSRSSSVRSSESETPSYVSAVQPTEDQLMEWRLRQHFQHSLIPPSSTKVIVPDHISWISECDSLYYSINSPCSENN